MSKRKWTIDRIMDGVIGLYMMFFTYTAVLMDVSIVRKSIAICLMIPVLLALRYVGEKPIKEFFRRED